MAGLNVLLFSFLSIGINTGFLQLKMDHGGSERLVSSLLEHSCELLAAGFPLIWSRVGRFLTYRGKLGRNSLFVKYFSNIFPKFNYCEVLLLTIVQ